LSVNVVSPSLTGEDARRYIDRNARGRAGYFGRELTMGDRRRFSMDSANQGEGRHVIMNGRLAHELLHAINGGRAYFLRSSDGRLLQTALYTFKSELLTSAPALQ